jgi:hypothetical protein
MALVEALGMWLPSGSKRLPSRPTRNLGGGRLGALGCTGDAESMALAMRKR